MLPVRTLLARHLGVLFVTGLAVMEGACGGNLPEPSAPPEDDGADGSESVGEAPVDLSRVTWPATAEPLPEDVPWWVNGFVGSRGGTARHALRFTDAYERYIRAGALAGDIDPTVVFCQLRYSGGAHDPRPAFRSQRRARADLTVFGRFGEGHEFTASAPDNEQTLTFGAPTPALRAGDTLTLRVRDRDFIRHDSVGSLTLTYEGSFPVEQAQGPLTARCVALPPAEVRAREPRLLRASDEAMARTMLAEHATDAVPYLTLSVFDDAREALGQAAMWLSWAHPEVQLRRARLDVLIAAHEARQQAEYAALVADLAGREEITLPSGERLRAEGVSCERAANGIPRCEGRYEIDGDRASEAHYARVYTPTSASPPALLRFVRLNGAARVYAVDVTSLYPNARLEAGPAELILEVSIRPTSPGARVLLRRSADRAHAPLVQP